jgi:purine-binding chemotaxis protein CheW
MDTAPIVRSAAEPSRVTEKCLTFRVGGDLLAMPIRCIREVIRHEQLTSVPLAPPFLRGVLNLRGAVVPVIDLSVRFDRDPVELARRTSVVIVEVRHEGEVVVLGLLVDQVQEVVGVDTTSLGQPPAFGTALRREFIRGVASLNQQFVIVLDVDRTLSVAELAALKSLGA